MFDRNDDLSPAEKFMQLLAELAGPEATNKTANAAAERQRALGTREGLFMAEMIDGATAIRNAQEIMGRLQEKVNEDPLLLTQGEILEVESAMLRGASHYGEAARIKGQLAN